MSFKEKIKSVLLCSGILRFRQVLSSRSVLIVAYHSVSANRQAQSDIISPGITTDADRFDEQMRILREEYNPVTLDEISDWLKGICELPARSVAVTFDDGFADNYYVAAPIMEKYGIRGTIYLTADAVQRNELPWFCRILFLFQKAQKNKIVLTDTATGRTWNLGNPAENREAYVNYGFPCAGLVGDELRDYVGKLEAWFGFHFDKSDQLNSDQFCEDQCCGMMTFDQARELRQRGHIIGNHTFSHCNLAHIPAEKLRDEIGAAGEIIAAGLGERVEHFSYPHPCYEPQWNEASLLETATLAYKTAVLTSFGLVKRNCSRLLLPRIMLSNQNAKEFRWKLETALCGIET
ncbi:MAG: polysaccharide deacetylase family protein [Planctomycetaceae bacterium]|jgi:peptidoglycan/xylan/chitin deacetylase (PgdA/CDA1 family)|nr:polysaccharide deacetylase family protein [Planctomycetaceae bacterium]